MRYTRGYEEYKGLVDTLTKITKDQSLTTNLIKLRKSVSREGGLQTAFEYLLRKRKECIQNWENTFANKFEDKRRRKVFVKKNLEDGSVILIEEDDH
jgi:hypothetical protein